MILFDNIWSDMRILFVYDLGTIELLRKDIGMGSWFIKWQFSLTENVQYLGVGT